MDPVALTRAGPLQLGHAARQTMRHGAALPRLHLIARNSQRTFHNPAVASAGAFPDDRSSTPIPPLSTIGQFSVTVRMPIVNVASFCSNVLAPALAK